MARTKVKNQESTPERIMDAAEVLFSKRGYFGASLRDIAKEADVQMSMVNYHFGPKEDLFRKVVERRAHEHVSSIEASLETLLDGHEPSDIGIEELIRALVTPMFDRYLNGGEGWRNYIQLLARALTSISRQHPLSLLSSITSRSWTGIRTRF
jgi:AcrR family transcriptional regulator